MKRLKRLSEEDRRFLDVVRQAAFSNPFSKEREEANAVIVGKSSSAQTVPLDEVVNTVAGRIATMFRDGELGLDDFEPSEHPYVRYGILFNCYHRHMDEFDTLIAAQLAGEADKSVPFARSALAYLAGHGFSRDDASRYFAFFFQMRRAFYFLTETIAGDSDSVRRLRQQIWSTIFTHDIEFFENHLWNRMEDFSTLILGDTGTGKGAIAAAIGRSGFIPFDTRTNAFSENFTDNFIAVNLAQFAETLLESELFGHRKGAFTGATDNHRGVFSLCNEHGVIFLDEIGEVSIPTQIKLLQVLQERTFTPVGSRQSERFSGRVLAATNQPLQSLRQEGHFRNDFFYRLCANVIEVPSLCQRISENPRELDLLVDHLLTRMAGENGRQLKPFILDALRRSPGPGYHWPGNVRELEQAIRRILLVRHYDGEPKQAARNRCEQLTLDIERGEIDCREMVAAYCAILYDRFGTYEEVARRTGLDRRTVKKNVETALKS